MIGHNCSTCMCIHNMCCIKHNIIHSKYYTHSCSNTYIVHMYIRKLKRCRYMNSLEPRKKEPFLDVIRGRNFLSLLLQHGTSESRNSIIRSTSRTHYGIVDKRSEVEQSCFPPATTCQEKSSLTDKLRVILTSNPYFPLSTLAKITPDMQDCLVVSIHPKKVHIACHRNMGEEGKKRVIDLVFHLVVGRRALKSRDSRSSVVQTGLWR